MNNRFLINRIAGIALSWVFLLAPTFVVFLSGVIWMPGVVLAQSNESEAERRESETERRGSEAEQGVPMPADSLSNAIADTIFTDDLDPYFKRVRGARVSPISLKSYPALYYVNLPVYKLETERMPDDRYRVRALLKEYPSGATSIYSRPSYSLARQNLAIEKNWAQLLLEARRKEERSRGLLDFSISIPGGEESAFTTIFGSPEVNLRVNGVATMNVGASIQNTEDISLPEDQRSRVDPTFDQSLQLNIQGTIGDKLTIQTDWDTERAFDFQNRLSIVYEGYDSEILQSIELGNVNMNTGNSLIRGGGALFGIKSVAQFGPLRVTSVLSQQDGESNVETISGGSQEQQINIRPSDYEDNRHFFIDFFTRQEFENSVSNPQQLRQTLQIADVEVWILKETTQTEEGSRRAVALADIGVVKQGANFFPPDNNQDIFTDEILDQFRDPEVGVTAADLGVEDSRNFEEGYFTPLEEGQDYTINKASGYISLRRALSARDVLAVAFNYRGAGGQIIPVGELNQGGSNRLYLKMLRPRNVSTDNALFGLTMRNIYSIGSSSIVPDNLEIDLAYTEENVSQNRLPGRTTTLLQDLGLDRVDAQGAPSPDNLIDFGTGTLDAAEGKIIFPYLEPFGARIRALLQETGASELDIDRLSYTELYNERQQNAAQSSKNGFYRFEGVSKGGVQDNYNLGFALVEGSVVVRANGVELQEGVDYQVDYAFGSITILNDRYTAPGQDITIEYENQSFLTIEQKTFTGIRAEYEVNKNILFGGTFFRFNERPLDDKIRVGNEPINNSIIGFDSKVQFEAPVITRALDALPLIQTRAPSQFTFSGEFAQLRPNAAETQAVRQAARSGDLFSDEERGLSFLDDFEGSSIKLNLLNPTRWNLASAPAAVPGYAPDTGIFEEDDFPGDPVASNSARADRADLRGQFSFYSIPRNISSILGSVTFTPESRLVRVTDVFPGRETNNPQEEFISTLDIHFNPQKRGQYNFNPQLKTLLEQESERTWGGMTTVIPSGQEDFTQNNIEFLEFWVQPLLPGGAAPGSENISDYSGKVYIDVGLISEDVIPNAKLNSEDGLAQNPGSLILDDELEPRSALPANPPPPEGQFSNANRDIEDVGLDGLPNRNGILNDRGDQLDETTVFSSFLDAMRTQFGQGSETFSMIENDPAGDDYIYYGQNIVDNLPLHERFHRMLGFPDGNTPIDQSDKRPSTNRPDNEGLVNSSTVALTNAYYQYEVEMNPADPAQLEIGAPGSYIIDKVDAAAPEDRWYQVRIPISDFKRKFGDINDFQNITYVRMWMSGYQKPFTMRFASFEFVGSQWRQDETINNESDPAAELKISTINIEENSNRTPFPYRQPEGAIRAQNRGSQLQSLQNEQSLVLEVENLGPESVQLVRRVYPSGINLINYSNMRMFVHGEGFENREDIELVLRFGNDLKNNYYEYRQPVTPSDEAYPFQPFDPSNNAQLEDEAAQIWLYDLNSMNIILSAFNQLKQLRDQETDLDPSEPYERGDLLPEGAPGSTLAIVGNPSLTRVSEIGLGIRNPFSAEDPEAKGTPFLNAQVWLNELRVSGYDNEQGWAAKANASLKLADFATVNGNISRETQGFGALNSRLGQRRTNNELSYDLNTTVNLHKFIPERFGWNIPVSLSARRSSSIPKFLPNQGDIRLSDYESAVRANTNLTLEEQDEQIRLQRRAVETFTEKYSINLSNFSKKNSEFWLTRVTLDNLSFNYNYNEGSGRNPQLAFQNNWGFTSSVRYNLSLRSARFIKPFWLLRPIPVLNLLSGFELGLLPTNLTSSISTSRTYEERKRRPQTADEQLPLQQTHNFNYNTNVGVGYNLTRSISLNFQSKGAYDLSPFSIEDAGLTGADSTAFSPIPTFDVIDRMISDTLRARKSSYSEEFSANWQPKFNAVPLLSWINYSSRYAGGFRWENTPIGSNLGARLGNSFRLDNTLRLDIGSLFKKVPLYSKAFDADKKEATERVNRAKKERSERDPIALSEHLVYYARKLFLVPFSLQSLDVTYGINKTSSQAGYAGGSSFFDQFNNPDQTPDIGYRLGFLDTIPNRQLIKNPEENSAIQLPANRSRSDNVSLSTKINPFKNLSIDLSWQAQWDEKRSETITLSEMNEISSVITSNGNVSSSVWAFGPGYRSLFETQLQTAFDDMSFVDNSISDSLGNADGRTILERSTVQEDFLAAYLGNSRVIDSRGFIPFPLPNWKVNLTGVENLLPFINRFMQRATLSHSYSGSYRMGWARNNDAGAELSRSIGSYTVDYIKPEYEPNSVNIEQRFSPFAQLSITWTNGLRTQIGYDVSRLTSFALSNFQVTEKNSKGVKFSVNYTIKNFRIPFLFAATNNVDITLNGSLIDDLEESFLLDTDLTNALNVGSEEIVRDPTQYETTEPRISGQKRINGSVVLGYRFSSTLQVNLDYTFSQIDPKSTRTFRRTTHDIRFNIRINIRSS